MNNDGVIRNAIGAVVGIKLLETGMKVVDKQRKKLKKDGNIFGLSKKNNKWY